MMTASSEPAGLSLHSCETLIYDSAHGERAKTRPGAQERHLSKRWVTRPQCCRSSFAGETVAKKIVIKNPWSGEMVERDISGLTPAELEAYPLDEGVCDEIARAIAPCLPEEFLAAYVKRVGAIAAGVVIFGAQLVRRGLSDPDDGSVSPA
jgi:hypothetical protein